MVYISHSTPVEVSGQLWELVLFSRHMGPNSYHQAWKQVIFLLRHLSGSFSGFLKYRWFEILGDWINSHRRALAYGNKISGHRSINLCGFPGTRRTN